MQTLHPLIRTKIRPPSTRLEIVYRPRLQEQIAQGLRGPLTLVTAPAGFGKTTLVASCLAGCGIPVAWLSLEKDDNQPTHFLRYLAASLREACPAVGEEAELLLTAVQPAPPDAVLTCLVNDLDTAGEMALVLDDYHHLTSPAVHEQVIFLLGHLPATFHLVIATRSDPPLPLARLRARGQVAELRAADMRFTGAEAAQFLNRIMQLNLDAGKVAVLEERTEGWIAGLQMASLALRGRISAQGREDVEQFLQAFAGTNRFIMDYLLEEVLAHEPEEVQSFLLRTSFLTRLAGSLCDAVTGGSGSQEMLEQLEKRSLFIVPLDDDRSWYRYHNLFADLLQARLRHLGPEVVARLYSRAAEWCERAGQVAEAVSYTFAALNYERAAGLVERHWQQLSNNGEIDIVRSWMDALPEDIVRDSAPLSTIYASILWLSGQVEGMEAHIEDAERALKKLDLSDSETSATEFAILPAALAALRSLVARFRDEHETARDLAENALHLIPDRLPAEESAPLYTLVHTAMASACDGAGDLVQAVAAYAETIRWSRISKNAAGIAITYRLVGALLMLGRLRAADEACRDALVYMQSQGMARLPAAGILHVALSEVLVERNDLRAAEDHLAQGIELGRWSGRLDTAKNAASVLSRIRQARGDAGGALAAVQEAEAALVEPVPLIAKAGLYAIKARILAREGSLSEAAQCVEKAQRYVGQDRGQTRELVSLAAARVQSAQRNAVDAASQLAWFIAAAEERGLLGAVLELRILRSLVLAQQGSSKEAGVELERALSAAESEGYARIFIDEGPPMRVLLVQWLEHAAQGRLRDYAAHLLSQFDFETKTISAGPEKTSLPNDLLLEPLSQRELEVLQLMALGRTNQEIARQLVVAVGTIKAHAASIYRKLDTANRTEAVARARQLGILA